MIEDEDYQLAYRGESDGRYGSFGIKILLAGRPITEKDGQACRDAVEPIYNAFMAITVASDQEAIKSNAAERTAIIAVFGSSRKTYVEEIPNEYCSSWCCAGRPWFLITTKIGSIKIGWRKRIINIDWSRTAVRETAEQLFPGEDTTKDGYMIHAWGYDKAVQYIDKLHAVWESRFGDK